MERSVVDQNVQPPKHFNGALNGLLAAGGIAHVAMQHQAAAAFAFDAATYRVGIAVFP